MKNGLTITILVAAALCACSQKQYNDWNHPVNGEEGFSHDMIVLGEQLEDPYSVEYMTKALQAVAPSAAERGPLAATDFYVRFLPKDGKQMKQLEDKGLLLIDHPLDYRIVREGDWYHDPDIPEGDITWQYAVVPVNFTFPKDVRYERLDDCYIADNDPLTRSDGIDWAAVEREAFRLSGNGDLLAATKAEGEEGNGVAVPKGRIAIMDPDFSDEPVGVKGVKVCCNSFVKISVAYTDEEGYYQMSRSFSGDVRYRLVFQNAKGFCQGVNLILIPASMSTFGKQPSSGYSVTIDQNSDKKLFIRCVVNNAGYDFLEECEASKGELASSPKDLRIWNFQLMDQCFDVMMHQGVLVETIGALSELLGEYAPLVKIIMPDVLLGHSGSETYAEIYANALHAFAEAGHYSRAGKDWWGRFVDYSLKAFVTSSFGNTYGSMGDTDCSYCEVAETYAFYCQSVLFRRHYPDSSAMFGTSYWFCPQIFMYMDERGLGLDKIAPLMTADVVDMDVLKLKLLSYYPEFKNVISEAFIRYDK